MTRTKHTAPTFSEQLRAAIEASEHSMLGLCRETGIDRAAMSRFVNGKAGLRLETVDRIVEVLGLRLVTGSTTSSRGKRGKP